MSTIDDDRTGKDINSILLSTISTLSSTVASILDRTNNIVTSSHEIKRKLEDVQSVVQNISKDVALIADRTGQVDFKVLNDLRKKIDDYTVSLNNHDKIMTSNVERMNEFLKRKFDEIDVLRKDLVEKLPAKNTTGLMPPIGPYAGQPSSNTGIYPPPPMFGQPPAIPQNNIKPPSINDTTVTYNPNNGRYIKHVIDILNAKGFWILIVAGVIVYLFLYAGVSNIGVSERGVTINRDKQEQQDKNNTLLPKSDNTPLSIPNNFK